MNPDQDAPNNPNAPGLSSPPEDDNRPPVSEPGQPAPQPVTSGDPKRKKLKWLWIFLIILLILGIAAAGYWWWKDKDKKDDGSGKPSNSNSSQQETQQATCDDGFTEYTNEDLGLAFCYPTDWGAVTAADAKFEATDTGERWLVSFAAKSAVNLGVVSEDWSTEAAREITCADPAVQTLPAFSPFSTTWETDGTPVSSATRGIEVEADKYLIEERVDDLLTGGVCIQGYTIINGDTYTHTVASYYADFSDAVSKPQQHVDSPNTLVPEADRDEFYTFVKSVRKL